MMKQDHIVVDESHLSLVPSPPDLNGNFSLIVNLFLRHKTLDINPSLFVSFRHGTICESYLRVQLDYIAHTC